MDYLLTQVELLEQLSRRRLPIAVLTHSTELHKLNQSGIRRRRKRTKKEEEGRRRKKNKEKEEEGRGRKKKEEEERRRRRKKKEVCVSQTRSGVDREGLGYSYRDWETDRKSVV